LRDYFVGNFGFVIPSLVYMYLGASAKEIFTLFVSQDENLPKTPEQQRIHTLKVLVISVGVVVMLGVFTLIGCLTKR
jgi:hypothetical protein